MEMRARTFYFVTELDGSVIVCKFICNGYEYATINDHVAPRKPIDCRMPIPISALCEKEGKIVFVLQGGSVICRNLIAAFESFEEAIDCWISPGLMRNDARWIADTDNALCEIRALYARGPVLGYNKAFTPYSLNS